MSPGVTPGDSAGTMTPAEREAHWALTVRLAIDAAIEAEARAVTGQVLARLDRGTTPAGPADHRPSEASGRYLGGNAQT